MNYISEDKARELYNNGATIGWAIPHTGEQLETSEKRSGRSFDYWHGFIMGCHGENRLYLPEGES